MITPYEAFRSRIAEPVWRAALAAGAAGNHTPHAHAGKCQECGYVAKTGLIRKRDDKRILCSACWMISANHSVGNRENVKSFNLTNTKSPARLAVWLSIDPSRRPLLCLPTRMKFEDALEPGAIRIERFPQNPQKERQGPRAESRGKKKKTSQARLPDFLRLSVPLMLQSCDALFAWVFAAHPRWVETIRYFDFWSVDPDNPCGTFLRQAADDHPFRARMSMDHWHYLRYTLEGVSAEELSRFCTFARRSANLEHLPTRVREHELRFLAKDYEDLRSALSVTATRLLSALPRSCVDLF